MNLGQNLLTFPSQVSQRPSFFGRLSWKQKANAFFLLRLYRGNEVCFYVQLP